jgi:glutamate-1-semialdehyde 2,1-aminomutase
MASISFNAEVHELNIRNKTPGSWQRYQRALCSLAGGVSSGIRRLARPFPLYFTSGCGADVRDVDGNTYIDYGLAWGPLILGHSPVEVTEAIAEQAGRGTTFGAQHDLEFEVAEYLTQIIPCADLVAFANSGTEIVQVALRLARAFTHRRKFLKFEGHYHGWDDSVLVSYHPTSREIELSGNAAIGAGMGQRSHCDVLVAQWNDTTSVENIFVNHGDDIAAVICEPLLCNSGCIRPEKGFLEFLRDITTRHKSIFIFDEVITGFRLDLAGAQGLYGVMPDLATYAKAIGGGLPLSALAGQRLLMERIADGTVVHAGTSNGNPIVLAAAKATLNVLARNNGAVYEDLDRRGSRLREGLGMLLRAHGYKVVITGESAVFHVSFMEREARCYRDLLVADACLYSDFAVALLDEGVLILPDGRWYVSTAHTDQVIDLTLAAVERALSG